jgi:hypothetical protein
VLNSIKKRPLLIQMVHNNYLFLHAPQEYDANSNRTAASNDSLLDNLLHQKSRIFSSKLEVLAAALVVRVGLLKENLSLIDDDKTRAEAMLAKIDHQALYHFREHRDKNILYQMLFALEAERRSQAVECWRDVVMVLRDFLGVWEAHEQSQARAIFLEHVGS